MWTRIAGKIRRFFGGLVPFSNSSLQLQDGKFKLHLLTELFKNKPQISNFSSGAHAPDLPKTLAECATVPN